MTDATEALARAMSRVDPITLWTEREAKRIVANLAALGYEVRPIEPTRAGQACADCGQVWPNVDDHSDHAFRPIEQASVRPASPDPAEAADVGTGHDIPPSAYPDDFPSAAAAPLVAKVLAAGDELTAEHGESCDCEICLAVQPLVDAAVDLAAAAIEREAKQQERERIRAAVTVYDYWATRDVNDHMAAPEEMQADILAILAEPSDD